MRVHFLPIPEIDVFEDATEAGAIQYACADRLESLETQFAAKGLRLNTDLLAAREGFPLCHIYYEPTVRGFRIAAEQQPVMGIYSSVDALSLLAGRKPLGDSLDIAKAVMGGLAAPVPTVMAISGGFPSTLWSAGVEEHFGERWKEIVPLSSGADLPHMWAQDHLKSGEVAGGPRILVPRRLYEGHESNGEDFRALLDELEGDIYVRSKLSWEGGDILAIHPPRQPGRTMLIHGAAANRYWGAALSRLEYSWILRTEFGADSAVDVGDLAAHADYTVAFVSAGADRTAVVAQPLTGDEDVIQGAADVFGRLIGDRAPAAAVSLMEWIRARPGRVLAENAELRRRISAARAAEAELDLSPPPGLEVGLDAYFAEYCTEIGDDCFSGPGKVKMLERAPDLLRASLDAAADAKLAIDFYPHLLSLIEGQIPGATDAEARSFDEVARGLTGLGFRVVRAPFLVAAGSANGWPGVSYVNLLAIEGDVFLPALGMDAVEQRILARLREDLGDRYRVRMTNAQTALGLNGGVHCVFALIRRPAAMRPVSDDD